MLKLSVAFALVALALNASAKPQNIATPATRPNSAINTAPKTNSIVDNNDVPAIERQDNTVNTTEDEQDAFDHLWPTGVNYIDTVLEIKESFLNAFDSEHRPKIKEIFDKYPEPDYFNEREVRKYLDIIVQDIKEYAKSKGLPSPFAHDN